MKTYLFLALLFLSQLLFADTLTDSDKLFDWAETQYPQYFSPPAQSSITLDEWYYRYYADTNNYLGVNTDSFDVYVLGDIFGGMFRVGTLAAQLADAGISDSSSESATCPQPDSNEPAQSPGPYDHTLSVATSTDGINFSGEKVALLEHASAPDSVIGPDGKVWVYYVNGTPGQHAVFIAKVQEDGSLLPFDCIRIDNEVDMTAVDPDVLRLSDGSYQLFFNPLVSASPNSAQNEGIYTATSTDGIHFVNKKQLIQQTGALNPSGVQLNDSSWLLTYTDETRTYIAKSSDGDNYEVVSDFGSGIPELVYLSELNEARLYTAEKTGLNIRSSLDGGFTWTELNGSTSIEQNPTVLPNVQDPSVLRESPASWFLYYRYENQSVVPGQ